VMKVIFSLAERVLVLHHGELIADGGPAEIAGEQRVIEAYLGEKFARRVRQTVTQGRPSPTAGRQMPEPPHA
jgi:branched-chain amino acid transport system ATP-binding protein